MEARSTARFVRMAPRKARLVVDLVRGRPVGEALSILDFTPKRAARVIAKTLRAAVANAENQQNVDVDRLYVKQAWVDGGPTLKRTLPRAQGRATRVRHATSHVTLIVDERHRPTA